VNTAYRHWPRIETVFNREEDHPAADLYSASVHNALCRMLPHDILLSEIRDEEEREGCLQWFEKELPLIKWIAGGGESSLTLSVLLLCHEQRSAPKFFHDLVSRWLLPGKKLDIDLFFATHFSLPDLNDRLYTFARLVIRFETREEWEMARGHFQIIESELKLGLQSVYHANRILEVKGLSADDKISLVQERISSLVQRMPRSFDHDIFNQMQHVLILCRDEYKTMRGYEHMSRIIMVFYLFQKMLRKHLEREGDKRHLMLKVVRTRLTLPFGERPVLGLFVGLNFLKENEVFEEKHVLKAIQRHIPQATLIEESCLIDKNGEEQTQMIYLEVEKEGGEPFSLQEIQQLRKALPDDLRSCIEQLMRHVFMPRNEEEVMRNIVTLSNQLKYVRDLPQAIISFDEQTDSDLSFTVILVRLLHPGDGSVQELFQRSEGRLRFVPDRIKRVGVLRKKHLKEATVFRVRMASAGFLRGDHAVDLYKARQEVLLELQRVVGEVRDFNGGMISKQIEVFVSLKALLAEKGKKHELLLENFFHSIFPVELRSVLNAAPLSILFSMIIEVVEGQKMESIQIKEADGGVFVLAALHDPSLKSKIMDRIDTLKSLAVQMASVHLQIHDTPHLGCIYFNSDPQKRAFFTEQIKE
jgi:hypothetical protein